MTASLGAIGQGHPAFALLAAVGTLLAGAIARDADLRDVLSAQPAAQAIRTCSSHAMRFVPQDILPADTAYEANIIATGEVPARDNLHDSLNALIWLYQPCVRTTLSARQARAVTQDGIGTARDTVRGAAMLLDENVLVSLYT